MSSLINVYLNIDVIELAVCKTCSLKSLVTKLNLCKYCRFEEYLIRFGFLDCMRRYACVKFMRDFCKYHEL